MGPFDWNSNQNLPQLPPFSLYVKSGLTTQYDSFGFDLRKWTKELLDYLHVYTWDESCQGPFNPDYSYLISADYGNCMITGSDGKLFVGCASGDTATGYFAFHLNHMFSIFPNEPLIISPSFEGHGDVAGLIIPGTDPTTLLVYNYNGGGVSISTSGCTWIFNDDCDLILPGSVYFPDGSYISSAVGIGQLSISDGSTTITAVTHINFSGATVTGVSPNGVVSLIPGVTSVGMTVPSGFTVTPSAITTSGTFAITANGTSTDYIDGTGAIQPFPIIPSGTVTHVGMTGSSAFAITGSPITAFGTINISGAGTTSQYIAGDGTLAPISGLLSGTANYIPYFSSTTSLISSPLYVSGSQVGLNTTSFYKIAARDNALTASGTTSDPTFTISQPSGVVAYSAQIADGVLDRRIAYFLNSTNSVWGHSFTQSAGASLTYGIWMGINRVFSINPNGNIIVRSSNTTADFTDTGYKFDIFGSLRNNSTVTFTGIPNTVQSNVVYYDTVTGNLSYGTASTGTGTVTSVALSSSSAFAITGSPITTSGTFVISGAGNSSQYIDGTGALQSFPSLTGYVPYTGATSDVNLGVYGLTLDKLSFNTTATQTLSSPGQMLWNDTDGTLDIRLKGNNVTLQVGQESVIRVVNKTGINLLEANYNAVYISGATGQRLSVKLADADLEATSAGTIGLVTETINNNQEGFVTTSGLVREINTTGSLQGETWNDGDILYLSSTAGQITNVKPVAPVNSVIVGYVVYAHAIHGSIFVKVDNGYELNELHNVLISGVTNNDVLAYESATSLWKNKSISGVLGYTPLSAITSSDVTTALGYTPFGGTNPLPVANGGTGISSVTNGDVFYATGGTIAKLAIGTSGQTLSSNGTLPVWATPSSGGMTNPMTTLGDIIYEDATPTPARLAGNTTTTQKFLGQVGNGTISAAPTWFDLFGTANTWSARQTFSATNGILFSYASSNVLTHLQSYVRTTANGDHAQWLSTDTSGNYKAAVRLAIQGSGTGNGVLNFAVNQQTTGTTLTSYLTCDGLYQTVGIFKNVQIGATGGTTGILSSSAKSTLDVIGSLSTAITTKTATYTATITDSTILCNAATGAITINLPTTSGIAGRFYTIKKIDSSVNAITIDANGTQTIDGALTYTLALQYKYVTIQTDGTNWFVTANN